MLFVTFPGTDSPYLSVRAGQRVNTPAYIGEVANDIAGLRQIGRSRPKKYECDTYIRAYDIFRFWKNIKFLFIVTKNNNLFIVTKRGTVYRKLKRLPVVWPWIKPCLEKLVQERLTEEMLILTLAFLSAVALCIGGGDGQVNSGRGNNSNESKKKSVCFTSIIYLLGKGCVLRHRRPRDCVMNMCNE